MVAWRAYSWSRMTPPFATRSSKCSSARATRRRTALPSITWLRISWPPAPTSCCSTSRCRVRTGQLICRELRQQSDIPVIVLTSRVTEVDEVMSMTMGADDFIPKPYSARVLVARVQALLRRVKGASDSSRALEHNGVALDLSRSTATATQTGRSIELTKNEMRILSLLIAHAGTIVSREAIMRDLWDSDAFVDDNTLTVNINRLRTTLEKIGITGYLTTHRVAATRCRGAR